MHKEVLRHAASVDIYALISLAIFVAFFIGLFVFVYKRSKSDWQKIAETVLDQPFEQKSIEEKL